MNIDQRIKTLIELENLHPTEVEAKISKLLRETGHRYETLEEKYLAQLNQWVRRNLQTLNNKSLFEFFEDYSVPDDYDGCFTQPASIMLKAVREEFVERLTKSGFLD